MSDLDNQTDYWNKAASTKRFTHPFDFRSFCSLVPAPSSVLDYGCGHGRVCEALAAHGYSNVVGIDSSVEMISLGQKENPSLNLIRSTGKRIPYPTASFGAVVLHAVLTCIPTNDGQKDLLEELGRVLAPNGVLYVSDYPLQEDDRNIQRYRQFESEFGYGVFRLADGAVVRHHDQSWIEELFRDFQEVAYRTQTVKTMNGNEARCFQYFGRSKATKWTGRASSPVI